MYGEAGRERRAGGNNGIGGKKKGGSHKQEVYRTGASSLCETMEFIEAQRTNTHARTSDICIIFFYAHEVYPRMDRIRMYMWRDVEGGKECM